METFLAITRLHAEDIFAAFAGGVAGAALLDFSGGPRKVFSTVCLGTIIGSYFGPIWPPHVGLQPALGWTCLTGGAAKAILEGFIAWARGWKFTGAKKDDGDGK